MAHALFRPKHGASSRLLEITELQISKTILTVGSLANLPPDENAFELVVLAGCSKNATFELVVPAGCGENVTSELVVQDHQAKSLHSIFQ